jgi:cytochrome P450
VLATFIPAMSLYPHVYRKAQEEMDRVVGQERLPALADRNLLPYLEAVITEAYRSVTQEFQPNGFS